jgi:hypothetical protein
LTFKGTRDIFEGDRIQFENTPNELKFLNKKANKDDAGRYTLTMKNEKGQDTIALNVIVVGKIFFVLIKYYSLITLRSRFFIIKLLISLFCTFSIVLSMTRNNVANSLFFVGKQFLWLSL